MNEVSIIINGVRYDAVDVKEGGEWCEECDLFEVCCEHDCEIIELCYDAIGCYKVFKKSDKKFEV